MILILCANMEPVDFQFLVLPLGILVFILAPLVFLYARREERQKKKLAKLVGSYVRERLKQEKIFAKELENLEATRQEKLIDEATYVRLKEMLERSIEQQRQQVRLNIPGKH